MLWFDEKSISKEHNGRHEMECVYWVNFQNIAIMGMYIWCCAQISASFWWERFFIFCNFLKLPCNIIVILGQLFFFRIRISIWNNNGFIWEASSSHKKKYTHTLLKEWLFKFCMRDYTIIFCFNIFFFLLH